MRTAWPTDFTHSRLWVVDSVLLDQHSGVAFLDNAYSTVSLVGCQALFAGSLVQGRDILGAFDHTGGDGIVARDSQLSLARTSVLGGDGTENALYPGGYGLRLAGATTAVVQADSALAGGSGGDPIFEQDAVSLAAGAEVTFAPGVVPTLFAAPGAGGASVDVSLFGTPGAAGLLFGAVEIGAPEALPGIAGELFFAPQDAVFLGPLALDGSGFAQVSLPVPGGPAVQGRIAVLQWIESAGGTLGASNPGFYPLP